ncbi:M48 family metallopeptidase [Candidatus Bealeia paramacronuclearis]|uniref:M48 family metallopeptidase n=1 Tax=Candidatus Bealeia paramacronuclearis TaxID=1921001 RepID=A0ABZ2C5Y4_9PROT|nr:M48 family metallopeptidase [Candidatus Bealeia paramacronuclearis]
MNRCDFVNLTMDKAYYLEGLPVLLKSHPLSKSLRLRVDLQKKTPILTVPANCTPREIEKFLMGAVPWFRKQIAKEPKSESISNSGALSLPDSISFLGDPYRIVHKPALKKIEIHPNTQEIVIGRKQCNPQDLIKTHLIRRAFPYFENTSQNYANALNVKYAGIQLKDYRSRWGVCHRDKRLTYSWRLAMAPLEVLHYVCAHEISHLLHFNHSPDFWDVVASLMPDYKKQRLWLKNNGKALFEIF